MNKYICLIKYNPFYPTVGMMESYNEVIESYIWGFNALGYKVKYLVNGIDPEALNIVFGHSIPCQLGLINSFPKNTIFINLERYSHDPELLINSPIHHVINKYQVYDYSQRNMATLNALNPRFPVLYAKIAYAPCLEKLPITCNQDIDVLHYGRLTKIRWEAMYKISDMQRNFSGLKTVTATNVWGELRDEFIARSKVIFNVGYGDYNIFEIVRVSYLLANKKAVLCVTNGGNMEIDDDLRDGVLKFCSISEAQKSCMTLVHDDDAREKYVEHCYEVFRRRDIRDVITVMMERANF
jgi:hypothetical protein